MESRNNNNATLQGRRIRRGLRRRRNVRSASQLQTRSTSTGARDRAANLDECLGNSVTTSDPLIALRNQNAQTTTITELKTSQSDTLNDLGSSQSEEGEAGTREQLAQVPEAQPLPALSPNLRNPTAVQASRILFRECQLTEYVQPTTQQLVTSLAPGSSIVNANRRLIERQIEAIQEADSRRWNFDFSSGIPLAQHSHRYVNYTQTPLRNCRPLNDQNQSSPNRFEQPQQHQWKTGDCQKRSDHKQDDV